MNQESNETDQLINAQMNILIGRLTETPVWDVGAMKTTLVVSFKSLMVDCIKLQTSDLERDRSKYAKIINTSGTPKERFVYAQEQVTLLNLKIKKLNQLKYELREEQQLVALKFFITKKFGPEVLEEFHKQKEGIISA